MTAARRIFTTLMLLAAGCAALPLVETALPRPTLTLSGPTPLPFGFTDERAVVSGICFESAFDAAGRAFVLRSPADLTWLFDSSDASGFCRRLSLRGAFDFADGQRALAGLWSKGIGCTADHTIEAVEVDDAARTFIVRLRFTTAGACPYELVRPFWIGITGYNGYDIRLIVEP